MNAELIRLYAALEAKGLRPEYNDDKTVIVADCPACRREGSAVFWLNAGVLTGECGTPDDEGGKPWLN